MTLNLNHFEAAMIMASTIVGFYVICKTFIVFTVGEIKIVFEKETKKNNKKVK